MSQHKTKRTTIYEEIACEAGLICNEKNQAYGDSAGCTAELLRLLYPNGIPLSAYEDVQLIIRIFDKLKRLATTSGGKDRMGEDPYLDIVGYGILGAAMQDKRGD